MGRTNFHYIAKSPAVRPAEGACARDEKISYLIFEPKELRTDKLRGSPMYQIDSETKSSSDHSSFLFWETRNSRTTKVGNNVPAELLSTRENEWFRLAAQGGVGQSTDRKKSRGHCRCRRRSPSAHNGCRLVVGIACSVTRSPGSMERLA